MSKKQSTKPISERLNEVIPAGKRLIVRDANGRKVMAFEAGDKPDQLLPPGYTTELVDVANKPSAKIPEPFERLSPKLAIAALLELLGVEKETLIAKADEIRLRDKADNGNNHDSSKSENNL